MDEPACGRQARINTDTAKATSKAHRRGAEARRVQRKHGKGNFKFEISNFKGEARRERRAGA